MNNLEWARSLISDLNQFGIIEFCICPGARNAPLVVALEELSLNYYTFFDERSAAFFALGRAKSTQNPVAVVTTSGSAVGELLPAVMEAYYSGVSLVLMTADRPRRYRGSGAPQTADQVGLYSSYVSQCVDLPDGKGISLRQVLGQWNSVGSLHLNICFDEPLLEGEVIVEVESQLKSVDQNKPSFPCLPLLIVGKLSPEEKPLVLECIKKLKFPVYCEALSGLREERSIDWIRVRWMEKILDRFPFDGVIRLGGVPTHRIWRDLDSQYRHLTVLSWSTLPFSGLGRPSQHHTGDLSQFIKFLLKNYFIYVDSRQFDQLFKEDFVWYQKLQQLFIEEPCSEPGLIFQLSKKIRRKSRIFLGNSLPIREWDLAASEEPMDFIMEASRGLNGIDGQLSTFLGYTDPTVENWAIVGDLTALYDLQAPWVGTQLKGLIRIVIINNNGGQIFSRLFSQKLFLNTHSLCFKNWAKLWGWGYQRWKKIPKKLEKNNFYEVIEINPDPMATKRFWKKYQLFS